MATVEPHILLTLWSGSASYIRGIPKLANLRIIWHDLLNYRVNNLTSCTKKKLPS